MTIQFGYRKMKGLTLLNVFVYVVINHKVWIAKFFALGEKNLGIKKISKLTAEMNVIHKEDIY